MKRYRISSGDISEFVFAKDQFAAWDTLRNRPAEDFGMIAKAEPDENDDPYLARTSMLMLRWGRTEDAARFVARGIEIGMPEALSQRAGVKGNRRERRSIFGRSIDTDVSDQRG